MQGKIIRCAIYTRKSTEEGLEQDFNSLQAQREACEAYIKSQKHEGWQLIKTHYDDGGFSGGNAPHIGWHRVYGRTRHRISKRISAGPCLVRRAILRQGCLIC